MEDGSRAGLRSEGDAASAAAGGEEQARLETEPAAAGGTLLRELEADAVENDQGEEHQEGGIKTGGQADEEVEADGDDEADDGDHEGEDHPALPGAEFRELGLGKAIAVRCRVGGGHGRGAMNGGWIRLAMPRRRNQ